MYRDNTGNYTGNSNNDFLVFEKTDGNNLNPDGGILFTNRGDNNLAELSVAIRGDGSVGIGTINPSSDLKLDVEGKIGATEYCDEDGNNCTAPADIGSGGGSGGGGGINWGNSCKRLETEGTGNLTLSCDADEYLVDVWVSDEGSTRDLRTSNTTYGYGGSVTASCSSEAHGVGILCCTDG